MTQKEIKISWIIKLQHATMRLFNALDEDYPDYRGVRANERAIQYWLSKITDNVENQQKIHAIVRKHNFNTEDLTFRPICKEIRELGYTIKEGE